mgnify:FL=1
MSVFTCCFCGFDREEEYPDVVCAECADRIDADLIVQHVEELKEKELELDLQ